MRLSVKDISRVIGVKNQQLDRLARENNEHKKTIAINSNKVRECEVLQANMYNNAEKAIKDMYDDAVSYGNIAAFNSGKRAIEEEMKVQISKFTGIINDLQKDTEKITKYIAENEVKMAAISNSISRLDKVKEIAVKEKMEYVEKAEQMAMDEAAQIIHMINDMK